MTDKVIINEQERDQLEMLIGKLHEASGHIVKLSGESSNTDFVSKMDVLYNDLKDVINETRETNREVEVIEYQEYRNRFLK